MQCQPFCSQLGMHHQQPPAAAPTCPNPAYLAQPMQVAQEQEPPAAAAQSSSRSSNDWRIPAYGAAAAPGATAALPIAVSSARTLPSLRRPSLPPINTGHLAASTPPGESFLGLASASPLPATTRATPSTRGIGFQPGSSTFQPGRPLSQSSMATTAFFTVASSASLNSMATPGGTGLVKTISNMTSLSGFLDGTVHDGDPSTHNEPGLRSPFGDGIAATPFSSSYGVGGQFCLLTGDMPYSPASAPTAPSPLAAAPFPLAAAPYPLVAAAAATGSLNADAASTAPTLRFYRDSATSAGPPPLSAFDAAALHLPRTHSVHPSGFGALEDAAPSLGTAPSLGPAAPLLSAAHIPSDQLEVELPASSVAAPGMEPLLIGSQHGSQHGKGRSTRAPLNNWEHAFCMRLPQHSVPPPSSSIVLAVRPVPLHNVPSVPRAAAAVATAGGVVAISISAVAGPSQPAPEAPADMSVMAGILHMMRDPHVAAFFFLTFLMGESTTKALCALAEAVFGMTGGHDARLQGALQWSRKQPANSLPCAACRDRLWCRGLPHAVPQGAR